MPASQKSTPSAKISRTKVDLFHECPRCFYLEQISGVSRPPGFGLSLNLAIDRLLKSEFDHYRSLAAPHPLLLKYGLSLIPLHHAQMQNWRTNSIGIKSVYKGYTFSGVPDDIWVDENNTLYVVDYKATANSKGPITALADNGHHLKFKRQLEFYQWLFRKNGFPVSETGYLVYATGNSALPMFDKCLHFELALIPVPSDDSWVEPELYQLIACMEANMVPKAASDCKHCQYVQASSSIL